MFQGFADRDCAVAGIEFLQDVADVRTGGGVANKERIADLSIGEALRHQCEHLSFSR